MKIHRLEIRGLRGVPELVIEPNGENFILYGPNGCGKSTVVDAIDFLLSGNISRFSGQGTSGIELRTHGCHLNYDPADVWVKGEVLIGDRSQPIEVERRMERPDELIVPPEQRPLIERAFNVAKDAHYVLTRREILKYITSQSSTRAKEIQSLLKVEGLEKVRKSLRANRTELERALSSTRSAVEEERGRILDALGLKHWEEPEVLQSLNELLAGLGCKELSHLHDAMDCSFAAATPAPKTPEDSRQDCASIASALLDLCNDEKQHRIELISQFLAAHADLQSLHEWKTQSNRAALYQHGRELISMDGACPLCETAFPPGDLLAHIEKRLAALEDGRKRLEAIQASALRVREHLAIEKSMVERLLRGLPSDSEPAVHQEIESWEQQLVKALAVLRSPQEQGAADQVDDESFRSGFATEPRLSILRRFIEELDQSEATAEDTSRLRVKLIQVASSLDRLAGQKVDLERAERAAKRSKHLYDSFIEARDEILDDLYGGIKDRFVQIYREIHDPEETLFDAKFQPNDAGLDLEVDFHGRGNYPPHALHSEGHQDSMGLALYLALAERLLGDDLNVIVLDDVVMSVDLGHRRELCSVLRRIFPERQFIITTHDLTWSKQLQASGVASRKNTLTLAKWSLEGGPLVKAPLDLRERILDALKREEVPFAAWLLRRGAESHFAETAAVLNGTIRYSRDASWGLYELMTASCNALNELMKRAKTAARNWRQKAKDEATQTHAADLEQQFQRRMDAFKEHKTSAEKELWAVNNNVHFNEYIEGFSARDFRNEVDAMFNLMDAFRCSSCDGLLRLITEGATKTVVKCRCGHETWNLESP